MTRIADALRRARTGSSAGADAGDARAEDAIQFFAPGQPAVVSPWDIREEPAGQPAVPDQPRPAQRNDLSSALSSQFDPAIAECVGFPSGERAEKLVISPAASALTRAQYSKLAAALHHAQGERGVKVLMLISAGPAEGKTLTVANLALTLSEAYHRRVLLIDADMRKPMIHEVFGVSTARGLSDLLAVERPLPLVRVSPLLSLLAAGEHQGDSTKTLTSNRMWALVEEARARFDWILLDTPPVGQVPDARLLAPMTDGALLVAMAGKTACDEIQCVAETFDPSLLLGVVLTRVPDKAWRDKRYYAAYAR